MTRALILLTCGSWLAMAQTPAPADWRFAHPNADMRLGINFQALLNSPMVVKAIEQGKAQAKGNTAQVDMAMTFLRTVDRVSISMVQKPMVQKPAGAAAAGAKLASTNPAGDMDVLVQVTGSFDPAVITGLFPSAGSSQVKAVGPHTILIGEGDSFKNAMARMSGAAGPVELDAMVNDDIWVEGSAAFIAKQAGSQNQTPMLKDLRGFALGMMLSESPVIDVALTAADADGAKTLLGTMNLMTAMAGGSPQMAAFSKNLSMTQDGSKVKMHLVIPAEVMAMAQQQMQQAASAPGAAGGAGGLAALAPLLGSFGLGGATAPRPAAGPAPAFTAPATPPNDGKIKIYGLDDGTKEISAPK